MRRCRMIIATLVLLAVVPSLPAEALAPARDENGPGESAKSRTARGGLATGVFTIRHRDVDEAYLLISPFLGPRGSIRSQPHQRTLTVVDTPDTLRRVAELIEAYDLPPRSVEVSVQLILATVGGGPPDAPPPPIRGVIEKLNALNTRWKDYRLVGDAKIMGLEGERTTVEVGEDYRVGFRVDRISLENRTIRFKPFELQRRQPTVEGTIRYSSVMNTVLNLRDSQLFIVGASKMERSNRALFMTITASVQ